MNSRTFARYHRRYKNTIAAIARKLANSNEDLFQDLVQEGRIALWSLDPAHALTNLDSWIRQVIHFKMVDFLRRSHPKRFESLEDHLLCGEQLHRDPRSGSFTLRGTAQVPAHRLDGYSWEAPEEQEEG